jgi:hypothetical protein
LKRWLWTVCAALAVGACGEETPTGVGAGLLPADAIQTFEVVLGPDRYLVWDTAFGQYSATADAPFAVIAHQYQGALDSRLLIRYGIPAQIIVVDTLGVERADQNPIFTGGEIRLVVDTAATSTAGMVQLNRATEPWDRLSAGWTFRIDTTGVQLPWSQPGGSPGAVVSTATLGEGADTLVLQVDSATIAEWADTANAGRGAVISGITPGMRLRVVPHSLRLQARSTMRPDTIIETTALSTSTFIYTPELADVASELRVGGTPSWRGILRLRERLDTVTVACPTSPGCRVRLGDAVLNFAALQLQPVPSPAGFDPELSTQIAVHLLLPSTRLPLQRSPLTEALSGTSTGIPGSSFLAPGAPVVELPITEVLRLSLNPADTSEDAITPTYLALLQLGSTRSFGFATFAERPSLRLIISISRELLLP